MKVEWITKLFVYFFIVTISGPFFDNWTTTEKFLFLSDAYAGKCKPSELAGPPTESFRCEEQQLAVNGLLSYARMTEFLSSVVIGICVDRFGPRLVSIVGVLLCIASWAFMCLFPKSGVMLKISMTVIGISINATLFPALTIERYTKRYKSQVLIFIGSSSSITCFVIKLLELIVIKAKITPMTAGLYFILLLLMPCLVCSYLFFPGNLKRDVNRIGQADAYIYPTFSELMRINKVSDTKKLSTDAVDADLLALSSLNEGYSDDKTNLYYNQALDCKGTDGGYEQNVVNVINSNTSNVVYESSKDCALNTESKLNNLNLEEDSPNYKSTELQGVLTKRNSFDCGDHLETTNSNMLAGPGANIEPSVLPIKKWVSSKWDNSHGAKWDSPSEVSWERSLYSKKWIFRSFLKNLYSFDVILSVVYFCLNVISLTYSQQSYDILYSHISFLLEFLEYVLPFSFVPCVLFMVFAKFFTPFTLLLTVGVMWLALNLCSLFQSYAAGALTAILLTITYSIYNTHMYIYLESKVDKDYYSSVLGFLNTVAGLSMLVNIFIISPLTDRKTILNINISMLVLRIVLLGLFIYRHTAEWMRKRKADKKITTL